MDHEQGVPLEELVEAAKALRNHGYEIHCVHDRTVELQENAELRFQLRTLKRQKTLKKQREVDHRRVGRAGRPLSIERKIARKSALDGSPYVIALYVAKGIAEHFSSTPEYKKLKRAFDLEYREHGVDPPAAPPRWSRYSLHDVEQAGWPVGWEEKWRPPLVCWICGDLVTDVYRRALMNGKLGIEWYPVHPKCGEELAEQCKAGSALAGR